MKMLSSIVIPTKDEEENIRLVIEKLEDWIRNQESLNHSVRIVIVDDTPTREIERIADKYKWIKYMRGNDNYGDSVRKGLLMSGAWIDGRLITPDKIIMMDADHPAEYCIEMLNMLDSYDMVVGYDTEKQKAIERRVTRWLCNNILGVNLKHPTCGFIGFTGEVLGFKSTEKTIGCMNTNSKYDMMHVEMIVKGRNKKLDIGEIPFYPIVGTKHNYNMSRNKQWLIDFLKLTIRSMFWF